MSNESSAVSRRLRSEHAPTPSRHVVRRSADPRRDSMPAISATQPFGRLGEHHGCVESSARPTLAPARSGARCPGHPRLLELTTMRYDPREHKPGPLDHWTTGDSPRRSDYDRNSGGSRRRTSAQRLVPENHPVLAGWKLSGNTRPIDGETASGGRS